MATIDRRGVVVDATDTIVVGDPNPGLAIKAAARVATTGNIVLSGLQTIDGVAVSAGDRVLVWQQTDQVTNGLYVASTSGWERSGDAGSNDRLARGLQVFVNAGTVNSLSSFVLTTPDPVRIGTSALTFAQMLTVSRRINTTSPLQGGGALSGDLTLSIATNGISYALMQQASASRLLGNPTGGLANVSEISLGATLAFSGTALQTAALTGDVATSANSFATTIQANVVSYAKLQQVAARSVVGNGGNALANAGAITGTASQFLGVNSAGTALAFQTMAGDVALSGPTATIQANAVSYAKMQQAGGSRLLGNPTGSTANLAEISLGATLLFSGTALQTAALTGDVTTSANSFVTAIGAGKVTSTMLNSGVYANPSATIGFSANNGAASTVMRSDATPALARTLSDAGPTWAGLATVYNGLFVSTNGFTVGEMFGSNIVGYVQTIAAGVEIPSSANFGNHAAGVGGYARTASTSVGSVGVYGQGTVNGSGTNQYSAFGANFVVTNTPFMDSGTNTGFNAELYGIEIDINLKKRATVAPSGNVRGIYLQNNGAEIQPTGNFNAIEIDGGGTVTWKSAFYTDDGAVATTVSSSTGGLNLGTTGTGNGVNSQPIVLRSRTGGGANGISSITTNSNGDIFLNPSTNGAIVLLTDGTTTTIQATSGSSGVRFNQYGAGTLTTNASGVITASSDGSLKNVVGAFDRGLADLRKMDRPVLYQWLSEMQERPDAIYAGWIAQGVRKGIPEAVGVGPDGKLTLADRPIVAALVNGLLEMAAELDALKRSAA